MAAQGFSNLVHLNLLTNPALHNLFHNQAHQKVHHHLGRLRAFRPRARPQVSLRVTSSTSPTRRRLSHCPVAFSCTCYIRTLLCRRRGRPIPLVLTFLQWAR